MPRSAQHKPVEAAFEFPIVRPEGYAGNVVPIIHQAVAVKAAIDGLEHAVQGDRDANF